MSSNEPGLSVATVPTAFRCGSCRIFFEDGDRQRDHYRSDWHRFNLKRKISSLPPVTLTLYQTKVAEAQAPEPASRKTDHRKNHKRTSAASNSSKASSSATSLSATASSSSSSSSSSRPTTRSTASSANILPEVSAAFASISSTQSTTSTTESTQADTTISSAEPTESSALDKLSGDLAHIGLSEEEKQRAEAAAQRQKEISERVITERDSLFDQHRSKSLAANVSYMEKKYGLFIPYTEYCTDLAGLLGMMAEMVYSHHVCLWCSKKFRSAEGVQHHMISSSHCKMNYNGEGDSPFSDYYDYSSTYDQYDLGSDDDDDDVDDEGKPDRMVERAERLGRNTVRLADNGLELVFADGTVVGHRSMRRYYKQSLRAPVEPQSSERSLVRRHREMGLTTSASVARYEKAHRQEVKKAKAARHIQDKSSMRLGVKANKFQPHFRQQILM